MANNVSLESLLSNAYYMTQIFQNERKLDPFRRFGEKVSNKERKENTAWNGISQFPAGIIKTVGSAKMYGVSIIKHQERNEQTLFKRA